MSLTPEQRTETLERHLHDHGHIDHESIDDAVADATAGNGPSAALGARIVARAWVDPEFRGRLLADAVGTAAEYQQQRVPLAVLEDTPTVHHVIVCTLCSCYPWAVMGLPPTWYKMPAYRSRTVAEPRRVLAEFGLSIPESREIRVWDSSAELRYMVLPERPAGSQAMGEAELIPLITRDALIGVADVRLSSPA